MNGKEFEEITRKSDRGTFIAIAILSALVIITLYICTLNETVAIIAAIITYTLGMLFIFNACDSDEGLKDDNN